MPRSGSGSYSKPPGTTASTLTTISSSAYNSVIDDLVTDANTARPVVAGGTGATTAAGARTNLGATTVGSAVFTATDTAAAQAAISAHLPAGIIAPFIGYTAPTGWVALNGGTIGSATSGATTRANADTAALYAMHWASIDVGIQTSTGVATTRGASAAADFAANKRLVLVDMRGEFLRGLDAGRGVDPGRIFPGSSQAASFLDHNHSGTTAVDGAHQHVVPSNADNLGTNTGNAFAAAAGADLRIASSITELGGGVHQHNFLTGGANQGAGSETRPRNISFLYCVKL